MSTWSSDGDDECAAYYAAKRKASVQTEICRAHGCAVNVHAPGCTLYAAQMAVGTEEDPNKPCRLVSHGWKGRQL